uniref:CUB domain-containing protein n=1 Tax=Phlebotomus papatasi TaxID=29031 RepID=A0A1B0DL29_PHLPP
MMFQFIYLAKYRRKCVWFSPMLCTLVLWSFLLVNLCVQVASKCSELDEDTNGSCMNGGFCRNGSCVCPEGWQGTECQFCGGKVRLTQPWGNIHDGIGNYSIGVKCSWLIDARDHGPMGHSLTKGISRRASSIRIHLEEFATECGWDHLYVYDGDSVESPTLFLTHYLHFFSDDAYNMSGFNISYKINGCPTTDSSLVCSGHGFCDEGICNCDAFYIGSACNVPICPNNCSAHLGQGVCDREGH